MPREIVSPKEISIFTDVRKTKYPSEKVNKLHGNLVLPSYVHGYSLAIQFMYNWFESKFDKGFFKGGIYVDGKHVLDDYKNFSKNIVKGENPRARMEPTIDYDFDRENIDTYLAPPNLYLRKSNYNESFFKDYENDIFLARVDKALRMNFNFKVRVNTRAQQMDTASKMELKFRNGSSMHEIVSADYHVPKSIILNIADRVGFEIKNNEVVDIISFISYLNAHSDLPFLFKVRAINQKPEFFIRQNNIYAHITNLDKLGRDDGERDGKLDFNFHIEMQCTLTIPIPFYYAYYSATDETISIETKELSTNTIAIYSINPLEIPNTDKNGWIRAAITDYMTDDGDTYMDLSSIFTGDNVLAQAIQHDLTNGLSPKHFINVQVYKDNDIARDCPIKMDWNTKYAYFLEGAKNEQIFHIAVYYDREYINELDIELNNYHSLRIQSNNGEIVKKEKK